MKYFIILCVVLPIQLYSQHFSDLSFWNEDSTSKKNKIFLNSSGVISSSSFKSGLYNKFIFGGFIDSELKKRSIDELSSTNIFGANAEATIGFIHNLNERYGKGISCVAEYKQSFFNEAQYTKDLPIMLLNGNTEYLGKSVALNGNKFQSMRFSSLTLGLIKTIHEKGNTHRAGAKFGYVMGHSHLSAEIESGNLKFAIDGSAVDLTCSYFLSMSDTSSNSIYKGSGFTSSYFYHYNSKQGYSIGISIVDLGLIKWNNGSMHELKKTNIHFEGFEIGDVINIKEDEINHTKDSLINYIIYPSKSDSYVTKIPCKLKIMGSYTFSNKIRVEGSLEKLLNSYQRMGMVVKPIFSSIIPTLDLAPFFIINGYSGYDFGLELNVKTIKNMNLKASIYSLPINSRTLGGSLFISYRL